MADYLRQMPHQGSQDMARGPSLAMRMHIDVPLLLLLLLLTAYGLFVLYSASGQNMAAVVRTVSGIGRGGAGSSSSGGRCPSSMMCRERLRQKAETTRKMKNRPPVSSGDSA